MRSNDLRYHGGKINAARALFPDAPCPWIDLSTGINPVPYPVDMIPETAWTRLPDPEALEAAARVAYGTDQAAEVVAAPGTQALIQQLPDLFDLKHVGILGFTYTEHEHCWRTAGATVTMVDALADLARFQVGIVVNPNNPDGRLCPATSLAEVAAAVDKRAGLLVIDEAFMDVIDPGFSLAPTASQASVVVLRSFGKTYGLAGLRLGFALTNGKIGQMLRDALGPWAVSGPAIELGQRALRDTSWLQASVARLRKEGDRLDALLKAAGFEILGGTALFRLARSTEAQGWFHWLCQHGILTRPFHTKPDQLRFGIPHGSADWDRLRVCLTTYQ